MNNPTSLRDQDTKPQNKQEHRHQEEDQDNKEEEEEEEEEEEAISLCDFPLNPDESERNYLISHHSRKSSSQPSEPFEFSNDHSADNVISHAEDIIQCGKLMPYKQQQQQQQQPKSLLEQQILILSEDYDSSDFSRRYCESMPSRSNSYDKTRLMRSSRSLDCKKLRRNSSLVMKSEASDIHRSFSKGLSRSSESGPALWKPRWYDMMFGLAKFPPEMDLRELKNRQVRRNPATMFPGTDAVDGSPVNRKHRSGSWGYDILRVLSCKNHPTSVAVTASIGRLVPQP